MEEQKGITQKGATMRLGAWPCKLVEGTLARKIYNADIIHERHRHRYEFNNAYREIFEKHGMRFSGLSPDGKLVEIMELPSHPWFITVQFHPEFRSTPVKPHPLFVSFIAAAIKKKNSQVKTSPKQANYL